MRGLDAGDELADRVAVAVDGAGNSALIERLAAGASGVDHTGVVKGDASCACISAASIDVVTSASPYSEQRTEYGVGLDWLYGNALMNVGYTNSDESDYQSATVSLGARVTW